MGFAPRRHRRIGVSAQSGVPGDDDGLGAVAEVERIHMLDVIELRDGTTVLGTVRGETPEAVDFENRDTRERKSIPRSEIRLLEYRGRPILIGTKGPPTPLAIAVVAARRSASRPVSESALRSVFWVSPRLRSISRKAASWAVLLRSMALSSLVSVSATRLAGATGSTYRLRDADAGHRISVQAIAMVQGATESATSAPTALVTGGTAPVQAIANVTKPTISGSTTVGSALTATPGAWTPADATVTLQWLRGDTVVGSGPSYTTTTADVGSQLRVRATASKSGWNVAMSAALRRRT